MIRLLPLVLFAAACGTTSDAAPAAPAKPAAAASSERDVCVQMFQRQRTCTAEFIPALVDLRARLDLPAGIAASVKSDRSAVIAQANEEWKHDSTDAAIGATCDHLATEAHDPADVQAIQGCLAKTDCGTYVSCSMPVLEKHLHK